MTSDPEHQPFSDAQTLRAMLRADLVVAMKARRPEAVAALRTTIAAIDNAEAVEAPDPPDVVGEHVAGAPLGVGSTEAARRDLSPAEVRALLQAQIDERTTEADRYDAYGKADVAHRLRLEAEVLGPYLPR